MSAENVSNEEKGNVVLADVRRSACGNCVNFTKRTKKTGTCSIHKTKLLNLKKGNIEERYLTVFKYHLCKHYA